MSSESSAVPEPGDGAQTARGSLESELAAEILRRAFDEPGCMRLTCVTRGGHQTAKSSLRPVVLRGERVWQHERVRDGRTTVRNLDAVAARSQLDAMLAERGARELHLVTASGDLHVRVTRKGRQLVSRSRVLERPAVEDRPHDRTKEQPLLSFDSAAYLRVTGMADGEGRVRASRQAKLNQVNAFLRAIDATLGAGPPRKLDIVDCGCGRADLTLAAYLYLTQARGDTVRVRGIDRNEELVAAANGLARDLGVVHDVRFVADDIAACVVDVQPRVVLSLHACDTATDEALARGVEWGCEYLLCAPCCQHALQDGLTAGGGGAMRAVLRHGILRERLADLLADTFRAQLLRILGYRVRVVEFVSADSTARNVLLRAEAGVRPGHAAAVAEYRALTDFWGVTPFLEQRLRARLAPYLQPDIPERIT